MKICPRCQAQCVDNAIFCPNCGGDFRTYVAPTVNVNVVNQAAGESYFDGKLIERIGWSILAALVTFITIGICAPFGIVMLTRWETKHTVIQGRRLGFNGTGGQLMGNWIKWILLSIITIGIYSLWIPIKMKKWTTKHTYFAT